MNFYASCGLLSFAESYYLMELVYRHPFFSRRCKCWIAPPAHPQTPKHFCTAVTNGNGYFSQCLETRMPHSHPWQTRWVVSSTKFALKFLNYLGTVRNKDCPLSDWCAARAYKAILVLVERDNGRSWKQQQRLHQVQA